jgi:hypothetical protein
MTRTALLLLLFLGASAFAASPGDPIPFIGDQGRPVDSIIIPLRSPVRFTGWLKDHVARFEGRFVLEGTYYYGDGAYNDGPEFLGEARIVPDRNARFPLLMKRNGPRTIGIDNPDVFAEAVIPASVLQRVRRKGGGYASGHVAIRAEGFTVAIVCDSPSYGTHFASVYRPSGTHIENTKPHSGC